MSQKELAIAADVAEKTVTNMETGGKVPQHNTLWRLQKALGLSSDIDVARRRIAEYDEGDLGEEDGPNQDSPASGLTEVAMSVLASVKHDPDYLLAALRTKLDDMALIQIAHYILEDQKRMAQQSIEQLRALETAAGLDPMGPDTVAIDLGEGVLGGSDSRPARVRSRRKG